MKTKKYYLVLSIGIICFGLLLIGGTFSWMVYGAFVGDNSLSVNSSNFFIDYNSSLTGELFPSNTDKGGLSGIVSAKIRDTADADFAIGKLYLYASSDTDSILYEGTELGVALKYSVYMGTELVSSGTVNSDIVKTGVPGGMLIYDDFTITKTETVIFTVYVWLDGNLVDNRYLNLSFSGSLNLEAVQEEY